MSSSELAVRFPPGGIIIDNKTVRSTEEMIEALSQYDGRERYQMSAYCGSVLKDHYDAVGDGLVALFDFVKDHTPWSECEATEEDFEQRWATAIAIKQRKEHDLAEIQRIKRRAISAWGENDTERLFFMVNTRTMSEAVSKLLSTKLPYEQIRLAINNQVIRRLASPGRGIPNRKEPIQSDFKKAGATPIVDRLRAVTLKNFGLQLNQDGFVCPEGEGIDPMEMSGDDDQDRVSELLEEDSSSLSDAPTSSKQSDEVKIGGSTDSGEEQLDSDDQSEQDMYEAAAAIESVEISAEEPTGGRRKSRRIAARFPAGKPPSPTRSPPAKRRAVAVDKSKAKCGCALSKATIRLLDQIDDRENPIYRREYLKILRSVGRQLKQDSPQISAASLCVKHGKTILSAVHMRGSGKSHDSVVERIHLAYSNIGIWEQFRRDNISWFVSEIEDEGQDLGLYAHRPTTMAPIAADFEAGLASLSISSLLKRVYPDQAALSITPLDDMNERGSTVLSGFYAWLGEDFDGEHPHGIWPLIEEEFAMYEFHLKQGIKRLGWQRNMWFSLIQQLTRMDPAYYMVYVFFRPDHAYRLISYPYYAKNTLPGESTKFRHIDINIRDYVDTGRGGNILQGSVSLTDEDDQNCTEVLAGMHKPGIMADWFGALKSRENERKGRSLGDGYVTRIDPWMWIKDDEEKYGCQWIKEVCRAGDVRLSSPTLPHGSTGPATITRRTILPWFIGIQDDHATLDTAEADNWEALSRAHRDQLPAPKTPSGYSSSKHGIIPWRFPAAVQFHTGCAISDCLVGRAKWDHGTVRRELDILFGDGEAKAAAFIQKWRKDALREYVRLRDEVRLLEMEAYGGKSYYHRVELGLI